MWIVVALFYYCSIYLRHLTLSTMVYYFADLIFRLVRQRKVLAWFKSYLTDRSQFVSKNGSNSSRRSNRINGVPHRSVLGPILCRLTVYFSSRRYYKKTWYELPFLYINYINDLLETYKPTRTLQSSSMTLFVIPRSKLKSSTGDRPFSASSPKPWIDIPEAIKCNADLTSFKRYLKTYLISMNNYVYLLFLTFNLDCKSTLELLSWTLYKLSLSLLTAFHRG